MPVTNVRTQWVAGNLEFVSPTAASTKYGGVVAVAGATTCAADVLAIPITHRFVTKTTGGDAEALTLANGAINQELTITLGTDGGGDGTLTPTTKTGFVSIVFADAGDTVHLRYVDDTVGWILMGCFGASAQPAINLA